MPEVGAVTAPSAPPSRPAQDWRDPASRSSGSPRWSRASGVSQIFALLPTYLARDGRARRRPAGVHRALQRADLRRRDAARPAVGRLGRQVQPQGRDHPERAGRGGRLRGGRPRARAVAARAGDAAHRVPARATPGSCWPGSATSRRAGASGTTIALFGASGPIGFAVGPVLAGILIDGFGWALSPVFAFSALLSVGTALLVAFGSKEVRPEVVPTGRIVDLAFGAVCAAS